MGKEHRFSVYMHARTKRQSAFNEYNYAAEALAKASIEERAAELASQSFESVAAGKLHKSLGGITDREREIALRFVRYAVFDRTDDD